MVIDCHCHAGRGDGFIGPWDTDAPLDLYFERARAAGIAKTVVFSAFHSNYAVANRELARTVKKHASRLIGFAFVHAARDAGRIAAIVDEAIREYGFAGIKLHRYDAPITREVCDSARAQGIPVIYDVMGAVATVELFATQYPDVNFIIPHLGSFSDDWRAQLAMIDHMERHPNVFADTSGVRRFDLLLEASRRAGDKLVFGSDGPYLHPGLELAKVRELRLSPDIERGVMGGTLSGLLAPRERREPKPVAITLDVPPARVVTLRSAPWEHEFPGD